MTSAKRIYYKNEREGRNQNYHCKVILVLGFQPFFKGVEMKLTIHEVAQVVGAKNDISIFEDTQLEKAEFDSRFDYYRGLVCAPKRCA